MSLRSIINSAIIENPFGMVWRGEGGRGGSESITDRMRPPKKENALCRLTFITPLVIVLNGNDSFVRFQASKLIYYCERYSFFSLSSFFFAFYSLPHTRNMIIERNFCRNILQRNGIAIDFVLFVRLNRLEFDKRYLHDICKGIKILKFLGDLILNWKLIEVITCLQIHV